MAGWFTAVKEPPPLFVSSYGKSDRDLRRMRIRVRVKEERKRRERDLVKRRNTSSRLARRNFDRFHGEKVYCSRIVS